MNRFGICLLLVLSFYSCKKADDIKVTPQTFDFVLNASLPDLEYSDEMHTKASGVNVMRLSWTAGDKLSVINLTTGKALGGDLSADASGYDVTFSGSLTGTVNSGDLIAFLYPSQSYVSEQDFSSASIDFSSQASAKVCVYSTVRASSNQFSHAKAGFVFAMSFIRINLSDLPSATSISSVRISGLNNVLNISGAPSGIQLNASKEGDGIAYTTATTPKADGSATVTLGIIQTPSIERTISVITSNNMYVSSFSSAALSANKSYNINVPGFVKDYIVFQDLAVRDYCIEHFDTNNDGEISFIEAAAVTNFSETLPSSITSFLELRFFTGLSSIPSFTGYNQLESIGIPCQISSIPDNAFKDCTSLENVICTSSNPPQLCTDSFVNNDAFLRFFVPDLALSDYKSQWPSYESRIAKMSSWGTSFSSSDWKGGDDFSGSI